MNILVVQETDWPGRNPILHHRMLESIALEGSSVVVLDYDILWARKGGRPLVQGRQVVRGITKFYAGSGVVVVRPAMLRIPVLARPTWLAMSALELVRQFRTFKPDVVVAYGLSNALVASVLSRWYRVPFVFHIFDSLHGIAEPAFLAPIARVVEQAVLRSAGMVVVVHRALLAYVRSMGVSRRRVRFIMNGFEPRTRDAAAASALRERLGVAPEEVMVLFVGWLYRHSGLLQIASDLLDGDRFAGMRLVVAGDGDLYDELVAASRRSPNGDRLVLLGRVPVGDVPGLVAAADVGLSASQPDPAMRFIVPGKVDEYLEAGLPILATRLPGMVEELGGLPSMLWVDRPETALATLAEVLSGHDDPRARLRELGAAAAAYGSTRESWTRVTERFREVLEDAVAGRSGGRGVRS